MWKVYEHKRIEKQLRSCPITVLKKYEKWKDIVGHFYKSKFRHNTLLLTKNVSLHINYMLRHHFLLAPRFVWNFEFLEVPL